MIWHNLLFSHDNYLTRNSVSLFVCLSPNYFLAISQVPLCYILDVSLPSPSYIYAISMLSPCYFLATYLLTISFLLTISWLSPSYPLAISQLSLTFLALLTFCLLPYCYLRPIIFVLFFLTQTALVSMVYTIHHQQGNCLYSDWTAVWFMYVYTLLCCLTLN